MQPTDGKNHDTTRGGTHDQLQALQCLPHHLGGTDSTFALPLTKELQLKYEHFFWQNAEEVMDVIL